MKLQRTLKHYPEKEVLDENEFIKVLDVQEHHWLLEHSHDFPEMIYVLEGKGTQFINGQTIPVTQGELYLIPIGTTHVFRPPSESGKPAKLFVRDMILRTSWLDAVNEWIPDPGVRNVIAWLLHRSGSDHRPAWIKIKDHESNILPQLEQIKKIFNEKPPYYQTRLTAYLMELLVQLSMATDEARKQHVEWPEQTGMHPQKMQIRTVLQSMPIQQVSLANMADKLNLSPRHLSRIFPAHFGVSFKRYVQDMRLEESQNLLKRTTLPISVIMEQAGFKDTNHFYRVFKQNTGQTPGRYRKKALADESGTSFLFNGMGFM